MYLHNTQKLIVICAQRHRIFNMQRIDETVVLMYNLRTHVLINTKYKKNIFFNLILSNLFS